MYGVVSYPALSGQQIMAPILYQLVNSDKPLTTVR